MPCFFDVERYVAPGIRTGGIWIRVCAVSYWEEVPGKEYQVNNTGNENRRGKEKWQERKLSQATGR